MTQDKYHDHQIYYRQNNQYDIGKILPTDNLCVHMKIKLLEGWEESENYTITLGLFVVGK